MGSGIEELSERSGIKTCVLSEIKTIAKAHGIQKIVLFGSRARGDYGERSDIDLAVYGGDAVQFRLSVDEDTSTLLKYDFVDMNGAVSDDLFRRIEEEGIVIYEEV